MNIALTGHTRGFGKFMSGKLLSENNVIGFSKSTGYDITVPSHRMNIIKESMDCDVFINNAQSGFSQTELLYDLYHSWKDSKKLILNIGSNARDFTNRNNSYEYSVQKLALNHASKQLGRAGVCKVVTVDFGFLIREEGSIIGYDNAFEYIELAIESLHKNYRLLEVLVAHD